MNTKSNTFTNSKNKLKEEKYLNESRFFRKKPLVNVLWHHVRNKKILGIFLGLPVKRVLSVILSLLLILVAIASASIISLPVDSNPEILNVFVDPEHVYEGDYLTVNVTIPNSYNIYSVTADFAGIVTIDLLLIDNSSSIQLWQSIWVVQDVEVGEHIVTISALGTENTSFQANAKWKVLSNNEQTNDNGRNNLDEIPYEENNPLNTNTSVINDKNGTSNQTVISSGLNVSFQNYKESYVVNESIIINGNVSYNNSLINIPVNLLIFSPSYNSSVFVNATDGKFHYQISGTNIGIYTVEAIVEYDNQTASNKITFMVLNKSLDNVSLLATDLYIWDDTDYERRYSNNTITFFANYSSFNQSIKNATCFISFYIGSWTDPKIMNYSNGYYVYNRSFDVNGTYEFNVWCSSSGYENKSAISNFFIYGNESTVYIVDPKEEHIDVVPGTTFYVERTVDGVDGTDIIFSALFSNALTLKKIEFVGNEYDYKEEIQDLMMHENDISSSPRVYHAGNPVSNKEKIIDRHRDKLPAELKQLDMIGHSPSFRLKGSCTVRIWFQTPSWEEITSGNKPSSGQISYLVISNEGDNGFDFESSTWWNSDWSYRKLITINSSQVNATLTNFPILVYNSSDSDLASHAQDDGDDIAFVLYSDNSTQLNHEIELFNGTTGELVVWVNVTSLSSSVDTKIWMYYGNSTCGSQENIESVWDSDYVMIHHLNETSNPHKDSTSNNNDGNESGGVNQSATGKVDGADYFDGTNDKVTINESSTLEPPNQMTVSAWIILNELGVQQDIVYKRNLSAAPWGSYEFVVWSDNLAYFQWVNNSGDWHDVNSSTPLVTGQWYYLVGVKNANHLTMYINGSNSGITPVLANGTLYDSDEHVYIGDQGWGGGYFNGTIDEVRISKTARNSSWINTSYNTMNNTATFLKFGSEQQNIAPTITGEIPSNQSIDVSLTPILNVTVNDADEDTLTAYWYSNSSSSWVLFATNSSIDTSGGSVNITQTNNNFSNYSIMYYWSVNLTDGTNWHNKTFHFTTESINTSVDSISPYELSSSPLTINATGPSDLNNVTLWYRYSSDNSSWGTWWNDSWTYCKLITINSSQIENYLTNFPVLIYEASDSDLAAHAQDNGSDIAFVLYSDNSTQLNHEIEFFNGSTGELVAWVNITDLSSINDTKIWMYYGNSVCNCQQNKTGVWDSHYIGVWHLNETSGTHFDSTSNGYNSENIVGVTQDDIGVVDGGDEFDGDDDYIDMTMNIPSNVTISAWAQKDTDSYDMLWCIDSDNNGPDLFFGAIDTGLIALNTWDSWDNPFCNVPADANQWHLYTTTIESGNTKLYINDQLGGTADYRDPSGTSFHISSSAGYDWDGKIDEVRISDISRSSSWINTSYNTMNNTDTFLSFNSERKICTDWEVWSDTNNPDVSYQWGWDFNFPNGSGYYEFNSIGKKAGSLDEIPPGSADTKCRYDNVPTIEVISPANGSTGVSIQPTCSIWANDTDGDTLTVYWFENTTGSWVHRQTNSSVSANSTVEWIFTQASSQAVKYWWKVAVNDGIDNTTEIFEFTTGGAVPTIEVISPANGSTGVSIQPTCNIWANDTDGDTLTVYWFENTTGEWLLRNTNSSVSANSTLNYTFTQFTNYSIVYYWKVAVNDGKDNISFIYHLTTEPINTSVDTIIPYLVVSSPLALNATGISSLDNVTLWYRFSTLNSTWWNPSWTYRKILTIDHNQVSGNLENFPLLVNITDSDLSTKAQSDGDDIAFVLFSDNVTQLNHEIEFFNSSSGELSAWINITALDGSNDTLIWMYYGNSACISQENSTGVWDSNYVMVQHLQETSGIHYDSTSYNNDGSVYGNTTQDASGKIGGADSFNGYFDEYVHVDDATSLDINDDITVEAWMNVDLNANNVSDGLDIGEANVGEIIDEYYYGHGMCYNPDTVEVSSNVFATVYRSEYTELFLSTYQIDDNGVYNTIIDRFEVDEYGGYEPDIMHIGNDVFVIVYRSSTGQGIIKTVSISSDGTINGIIDAITYDEYAYYPNILHISGNVYVIQYAGPGDDGYIETYWIGSDGTLNQTNIDELYYDTSQGIFNSIVRVGSSDFYAMAREGAGGDGWLSTVQIDSNGNIAAAVADSVEYDVVDAWDNYLISTDSDSIALVYRTTGNIPWILTFNISTVDGSILTNVSDSLQFDTYGISLTITNISDNYFAITYTGPDSDGWIKTITIADGWDIGTIQDSGEWDITNGFEPNFYHISGNKYGITYRSNEESFEVATIDMDSYGQISGSPVDSEYVFDGVCYRPDMIHLTDDIYVISYTGIDSDGYIKTVNISSSGTVVEVIDTVEFDTDIASYPDLYNVSSDMIAVAYYGTSEDGYIKTYQIFSNGTISSEAISEWEFDTSYGNTPEIFHISGDIYAIAYSGYSNDGFVFTFEIYSNGTINQTKIDSLEYATLYGLYQSVVRVGSTDFYAIANTGEGYDGWLHTVEILSNGSIDDNVTSSYEFNPTVGYTPNIIALSDNYYAIVYRGPDYDGYLQTVNIASDGAIAGLVEEISFDTTYGYTPIIQQINSNNFSIFYRGPDYDGWIKTVEITSSNGDIKEIQDSFEFDLYDGYEPSVCLLSSNIFAIAYRSLYYDGKLTTVEIKDNGQVSKSLDFSNYSYEQSLLLISETNRIYAVAYRGNETGENDGYIKTFQVLDTDGFINKTVIDTFEFEIYNCYDPKIIHIIENTYAIVYRGNDSDGYVTTVEIDNNGDVKQVNDTLEFDTVDCYRPDMIHVTGTIYAISYRGSGSDPYITTVNISNDGQIVDTVVDSQVFDTAGYECKIINVSDNIFAIVYRGNDNDGWIKTIEIYDNGTINSIAIDSLEFDESDCYYPEIIHIYDEIYAIFYSSTSNDGEIVTLSITSAGQISDIVIDRLERIEDYFVDPEVVSIGNNAYAAVFTGPGDDGYLMTFNISNTGKIKNNDLDRFQFQVVRCYTPDILYMTENISVITYRGIDTHTEHGVFRTIRIYDQGNDIGVVNFSEILHEFYFVRGTCFLPETVEVSSNIFATSYTSDYYKLYLSTYKIDSNGIFNSTIDDFIIDDLGGFESNIIHINGDVYAIAYRLLDSALGILKTVNISSDGMINGTVDCLYFDVNCYYPDIVHISGDVYAIFYAGAGSDGHVRTFHIANNGTINTTIIDELEFDTSYGYYVDVCQVGGSDYYALVYAGDGTDGWLSTVEIESNGSIAASVTDSIEFDTDYCLAPQIIPTAGDSFAFVYRSQSNLGILNTVNISSVNGSILTNVSDSLQFEFEGNFLCNNPRILHISGNYYAIAYEGPDSDGWLKTFDIASGWNIGSVQDSVEWDLENGLELNFYHISGNTYGITYRSNEYHFEVSTVLIKSNGEITKDIVDSEYVFNHISYYPDMIHLVDDIYVIAYRGIDSDGYMRTIRMTNYGNIIEDLDEFEFDIHSCSYPDLYKLSSDKVAIAYPGYGTDGYIKTYQIFPNGTINPVAISEWEFDTGYGSTPEIFHISGDIYAIAYSGGGYDGYVFTFEIFSSGVINQTKIDFLEYDTVYGLYQSVVRIGSTEYYAIANTGDGNDGWLYTVEIASNGSIDDNVTSSYEFNQTVTYEPNIIALSDNYYAIVYRGVDNDGYLQTVNIASDGTILGMVEELEYDISSGYEPILKHVSGDIYAIIYSGSGNDGWIKTIEITSTNGDIKEVQDSFEFEEYTCRYPSVLHVSGDVYAISYYHSYEQGKLVTLKIRSDGEVSKWLEYSAYANEQTMICVSETNGIYAIAYRGNTSGEDDGYLKTIQVYDDEGFLNKTVIDTLEFDTSYCFEPKLFHISGDIFAIAYRGTDDDGYITTVEIVSDGSITDAIVDTYEFDSSACFYPDMLYVSGITYAIAYRGSGNDPYVTTINITNSGTITKSVVSSSNFDTEGYWVRILHIDDDVYAITYSGPGNDGWLRTIQIYSNGTTNSNDIDSLEFDTDYGYYANMVHICNQTYAIFYGGSGTDGEIITLNITSTGQIVPATENDVTDRLKKFEIYFGANEILNLGNHVYGAVFYGTGGDGTFQSFEISNTGIIKGNPLEWLEWDINYANYVKAIYVGNNTYVLTHRGSPTNQYEGVFRTLTIVTNKGIFKDNAYGIDADGSTVFGNINGQSVSTSHSPGWNYIVLTYDKEDEQKLYLNGVFRSSKNGTLSIDTNNGELHIGQYFDGIIDEIRISSGVRNASWIQTSYNTMNSPSTFLSAGGEEINAWIMWNDASNPDTDSPWNWSFDFPNGTGYYEFYSIGKKVGSVDEAPPGCADANCYWVENKTINVTPPQWNQGGVWIGTSNETTGFYFNITNEGNLALDILIKASNATNGSTGARWNLTLTPGYNNFTLQYNKSGGGSWTAINTTYDTFVTNLGINNGQTFDLKMTMATVSSSGDPMSFTIYFKSVAS